MRADTPRETDLYSPIKALLETQGYEVKAEVGPADVVACRGDEDPVIVELKLSFSLKLLHQAVERQALTDAVYVAIARGKGRAFNGALKRNMVLCRRLGLGLMTVRLRDGFVDLHLDPAPYQPRQRPARKERLLREFARRVGDPNTGGAARRKPLVTAYRQDALRCLNVLLTCGPTKGSEVARLADVPNATRLMADDHYGWFERVTRGVYGATPRGEDAASMYREDLRRVGRPVNAGSNANG